MPKAVPTKMFEKRFWRNRKSSNVDARVSDSVSVSGKAAKLAKDLQENWLRYSIELVIMGILAYAVIEKIHEIGYTVTRDERNLFSRENEKLRKEVSAGAKQIADLQIKLERTVGKAEAKASATVGGATSVTPKQVLPPAQTVKRPPHDMIVETSKTVTAVERVLPDASAQVPVSNQIGGALSESCVRANASLAALGEISAIADNNPHRNTASLSSIERKSARDHIASLAKAFGEDKVLSEVAANLPFSTNDKNLKSAYVYAKSMFANTCRLELPRKISVGELEQQANDRCLAAARLQKSIKVLKDQAEAETILTPKGHLVETFNQLLYESKNGLKGDILIANMPKAETYYWHAETQKYLLYSIGVLGERLQHFSDACVTK